MRKQRSLFGEILDWMLAPLLLLWPIGAALTWLVAQNIANRPFDRALAETARALAQQVATAPGRTSFELPQALTDFLKAESADTVYFQVMGTRGQALSGALDLPPPKGELPVPGELRYRDDRIKGTQVRVAYLWVSLTGEPDDLPALVQVAETREKRSQLAAEIIKGVLLPQFIILPLAVLLVWLALARGIAPLSELQERIRRRRSDDLSPIADADTPQEVAPLVRAINDLLARLDLSIQSQKHFLANAAHQLKTPLAGLRMQAELAQREIDAGQRDPNELKKTLRQISHSSQRAAHMVNQLLALARAEHQGQAAEHQSVSLDGLAKDTVKDFVPKALEKRIDLGYEGPTTRADAQIAGNPVLVKELLRNLLDNAIQYTGKGGTVTVRVGRDEAAQHLWLRVEDTGPGIPLAERELVFQPFYRALGTHVDGSGLGLAIVREIAQQHGADILIEDQNANADLGERGTCVLVRFGVDATLATPS